MRYPTNQQWVQTFQNLRRRIKVREPENKGNQLISKTTRKHGKWIKQKETICS
jgi:hypothetical protein